MFGTFFLLGGLGLSGFMTRSVATGLLIVYFMLSMEVYLATHTPGKLELSMWKFSPTVLRVLLIAGNIALFYRPVVQLFGHKFLLLDAGGACGIVGMSAMLIVAAVTHTRALYQAERLP